MSRVSVFGPRELTEDQQKEILMVWSSFRANKNICLIHGGSKGTQRLVVNFEKEAESNPNIVLFKPYHFVDKSITFHPKLMLKRNIQILDNSDTVILFDLEDGEKLKWTEVYCETNNINCIIVRKPV